ncbi:MAG: hypothetical protein AUF76_11060 [Acidobacteria bacterium 13_1_20CM_2_65_9]|nr:MAG: hypothetical protein AUF76_11060 [Acidobacteria bacterium 13_1_20CM_2_65_9]
MRVLVAMAALVAAAARAGSPSCASTRPPAESLVAHTSPWNGLPPGFRAALAERDTQLVAIVAADIDADGDLDVVASDSTLQLHVWVNDGAGHLQRKRPARSSSLQPEPPGPTLTHGAPLSPVPTQKDPRALRAGTEVHPTALAAMRGTPPASSDAVLPATRAAHTPRAPPASPAAA